MTRSQRYGVAAVAVCAAFLSSYAYAAARGGVVSAHSAAPAVQRSVAPVAASTSAPAGDAAQVAGCACCGGGGSSTPVRGEASIQDGIQRVSVDTSGGSWNPNEIVLKRGLPARIVFAEGQGCLAQVVFPTLGLSADLTKGGAVVDVPPLEPGTYEFSCGMNMVFGKLVVQ